MSERFTNAIPRSIDVARGSLSFSEWIDYSQKMKPQSNAMSGGMCIENYKQKLSFSLQYKY